jgi:topoisomerase-4 subunit A
LRWDRITTELEETRKKFGAGPLGERRTELGAVPPTLEVATDAFVEREAITAILSDKGWIRAVKGAVPDPGELKFKEGDKLKLMLPCFTTDRLTLFATNGKAFTIRAAELPRGRGDGQPVRLLAELTNEDDVTALFVAVEGTRYLVASNTGRGFVVPGGELGAERRTGKQVLNLRPGEEAALCIPADGDHVAIIGTSRKLLIFSLDQVPEMARGSGVILQRYTDGHLMDAKVFRLAEGLTWRLGDRMRVETSLREWIGERGQVGRMPPTGFPRSGRFA